MSLALLAGGVSLLGNALGGRSRNKSAKNARTNTDKLAVYAIQQEAKDAARALELAREDEARLRAATGYDFKKLRDDAIAAGFNPLTALQATGGAGYDGRGAVVMSPFMPLATGKWNRANLYAGASGAVIETAGYMGDALASAGSAFVDQLNQTKTQALEAERNRILAAEVFGGLTQQYSGAGSGGATASPFYGNATRGGGGSLGLGLGLPKNWWSDAWGTVTRNVMDTDLFSRVSMYGQTNVMPNGPDFESMLSGVFQQSLLKSKERGSVPGDVERGLWDSVSDFGSRMIDGAYLGGKVVRRLGGWSYW